jgi:hypothetical protein
LPGFLHYITKHFICTLLDVSSFTANAYKQATTQIGIVSGGLTALGKVPPVGPSMHREIGLKTAIIW